MTIPDIHQKLEYRIRFDSKGTILGESSESALATMLGFTAPADSVGTILEFLARTEVLDSQLPGHLRPLVNDLMANHKGFAINGDYEIEGESRHLRISGQSIRNVDESYTHAILFLDDTAQTHLRRSYEYMFRLANHELKGPLAVVLGAAEQLRSALENGTRDEMAAYIGMIERNGRAIDDMVTRYLNLSRIESGALPIEWATVMLGLDIVQPLEAEMQFMLMEKRMSIEYAWDATELEIEAPREPLEIVMRNLISNALKYGDADSAIHIRQEFGTEVMISVENAGPNIPPIYLDKLFQRFVRLDATQGTKGSGLGLYNARKIVERWGGIIGIQSEEHATRFYFTIPQPGAPVGVS